MSLHVFGVRHQGPGCARSLVAALHRLAPDKVLVEGPPDAQEVLPLVIHPQLCPPVALLVYAIEAPRHAAFYPFTDYSPEWQALRYAYQRGIPARFIGLPQAVSLAAALERETSAGRDDVEPINIAADPDPLAPPSAPALAADSEPPAERPTLVDDPIAILAEAAGYTDHELW
jgi:hypothetical protein